MEVLCGAFAAVSGFLSEFLFVVALFSILYIGNKKNLLKSIPSIPAELEEQCCLVNCRKSLCQKMLVVLNATNYPHPAKQVVKSYDEALNYSHIF